MNEGLEAHRYTSGIQCHEEQWQSMLKKKRKTKSKAKGSFRCMVSVNNILELSTSHYYHYKIQNQLLVTGKELCGFI